MCVCASSRPGTVLGVGPSQQEESGHKVKHGGEDSEPRLKPRTQMKRSELLCNSAPKLNKKMSENQQRDFEESFRQLKQIYRPVQLQPVASRRRVSLSVT